MATYSELKGRNVYDRDHQKIGAIDEFYVDEYTQLPTWLTVKTGLFGTKASFVPLALAHETDDGLEVAITKDEIKDAPQIEADGRMDENEQDRLLEYYQAVMSVKSGADEQTDQRTANDRAADTTNNGRDAMTRSEEELTVDKRTHEMGKVRLQKYVTTENVNFTVPVKKEQVRLVQEPITGSREEGVIGEDSQDITLHEEEVQVGKRVVPKERVKLEKDVVEEEREVHDTLRKEQFDVKGDGENKRKREDRR